MLLFRRLYRIIAIGATLLYFAILIIPYQFRGGWKGIKKVTFIAHLWFKAVAKIVNLRIKIYGETCDTLGGLVVSNHLGYMDIISHGSVFPLRQSPKSDIAKWPIFGMFVMMGRPVWVNRKAPHASKKTSRDFIETMKHGMPLMVYAEGTSSDGTNGVLPFKSTPFEAVVRGDLPVFPVLTRYHEDPGDPPVCWYGDMTFVPHLWRLLGRSSIEAEVHILPPVYPEGRDRKEMAAYVHELMAREYRRILDRKLSSPRKRGSGFPLSRE